MKLIAIVVMLVLSNVAVAQPTWKEREVIDVMDDSAYYFTELKGTTVKDLDFPYNDIVAYLSYSCSTEHWLNFRRKFGLPYSKEERDEQKQRIALGNPPVHCELELRFNKESRVPTEETHERNFEYLHYPVNFRFDKEEKGTAFPQITAWKGAIYIMDVDLQKGIESGDYESLLLQVPWGRDDYAIFKFDVAGADVVLQEFKQRHFIVK